MRIFKGIVIGNEERRSGMEENMNRYLSVLALKVRTSVYKILGIMAVMAGVQMLDFYLVGCRLSREAAAWNENQMNQLPFTFIRLIRESHLQWIFLMAILGVELVLLTSGGQRGKGKTKETLWRLQISPRTVFVLWAVCHGIMLLMLILLQILIVVVLHRIYLGQVDAGKIPQSLFLACSENGLLHGLLPIGDMVKGIRLISVFLAWSVGTVYFGYVNWVTYYRRCILILGYLVWSSVHMVFVSDLPALDWILIVMSWICMLCMGISVKGGWGYEMGEM